MEASITFAEAYKQYGTMLYKIAYVYLGNRQDAEEAMQEAFFKLLHYQPQLGSPEHQKAWLIRVITNHSKNMLRSLWRKRVIKLEEIDMFCETKQEQQLLENVIRLPLKYKAAIHLYYYEGYAVKEIATILTISEAAVKMRLQRGRELLRMDLEGEMR